MSIFLSEALRRDESLIDYIAKGMIWGLSTYELKNYLEGKKTCSSISLDISNLVLVNNNFRIPYNGMPFILGEELSEQKINLESPRLLYGRVHEFTTDRHIVIKDLKFITKEHLKNIMDNEIFYRHNFKLIETTVSSDGKKVQAEYIPEIIRNKISGTKTDIKNKTQLFK